MNGGDDSGIEYLPDKTKLLFSQLILFVYHDDVVFPKLGKDLLLKDQVKDRLLVGDNLIDLLDDACRIHLTEMLFGKLPFVPEHLFVVTDPYLVEFFRVIGVNGQELDALVKRQGFIHGFLKHPEVKG